MKYILSLFILASLFACDLDINKRVSVAEILDDEWKTFIWSSVDDYPSFTSCDSLLDEHAEITIKIARNSFFIIFLFRLIPNCK